MRYGTWSWVLLPALAAPVLGQPEPPEVAGEPRSESRWAGLAKSALRTASRAVDEIDAELREQLGAVKTRVRNAAVEEARAVEPRRGLFLYVPPAEEKGPATWAELAEGQELPGRVILLVHGLDEPGGIWTDLAPVLAEHGYVALRFDYRNDDSARASARELEGAMRELKRRGAARVDVVAHSMGGLVARDVLTSETGYKGKGRGHDDLPDVHRLITLGTPNRGSDWARLAALSDFREHVARWMDEPEEPRHLLGFLLDGDGHAGDDLLPGSEYLEDLNSRPLPEGVKITAVVAKMAGIGDGDLGWLVEPGFVQRAVGKGRSERIATALKDAVSWVGDGVVCVDSGTSVCIEDVVEVAANHRTMVRNFDSVVAVRRALGEKPPVPPAIPVVLEKLAEERE